MNDNRRTTSGAPAPYPYSGPEALRMPVADALHRVIDPDLAMSVVDVGLVYGVSVTDERMHVLLTMTSAACPVADLIVDEVGAELDRVAAPHVVVDVELVWEPPWSADRMSPRAKAFMGW
jgi:metal-sulfur cluster biosynthetic enzyme